MFACRERILGHRDESQRLDQCSRLYDSSVSNDTFEHDASRILQVCFLDRSDFLIANCDFYLSCWVWSCDYEVCHCKQTASFGILVYILWGSYYVGSATSARSFGGLEVCIQDIREN